MERDVQFDQQIHQRDKREPDKNESGGKGLRREKPRVEVCVCGERYGAGEKIDASQAT